MFLVFQKSKFKCLSFEELNLKFHLKPACRAPCKSKESLGIFFEKLGILKITLLGY